ncbi:hypothetical protein FOL47_007548 [Perkinsus chesapeaki]|uniref:Uncharacterized protein n=1 Tax=Perkinsus chesapeaki TaxID=330153 RepID=A0A7J6MVY1_PERCH|nr:hypothetical protein FOL47_007548 [Perkinsus chesapeaki]
MSFLLFVLAIILNISNGSPGMVFTEKEKEGGVSGTLTFSLHGKTVDIDIIVLGCGLKVASVPYTTVDEKKYSMFLELDFKDTPMAEQIDKCGTAAITQEDFKEWLYSFRPREPQLVEIHSRQGAWFGEFTNP